MSLTLAQLLKAETMAEIENRLIAAMAGRGLPTDAWMPVESGGLERTVVRMVAGTLAKVVSPGLARATSRRFLDTAEGADLTFLAAKFYQLDRNPASSTIETVWLTAAPTAPALNEAPGEFWVGAKNGNRYVNLDPIVLNPNDSAPFAFQAELPGSSYNDPDHTIDTLITAPAGIECDNRPAQDFVDTVVKGSSTGKVTAFFGDVRPDFDSIRVWINAFGDIGSAAFRYSINGGDTWVDAGVMSHTFPIPNVVDNCTLVFEDGTSPSFIQDDIFTLLVADAILQRGAEEETDASLRARCRDRWSTLSAVPTEGVVKLWAQLASPEVHKVIVDADPNTPGGIIVTIASATGPASAAAQLAVSDYIEQRLQGFRGMPAPSTGISGSPQETALVRSAVARQITVTGTVAVPRAMVAAVQKEADRLWRLYLADVPLGGVVILAEAEQQIMDAGAVTFSGILLNGVNQNLQLDAREVAVPADATSLIISLTWKPV